MKQLLPLLCLITAALLSWSTHAVEGNTSEKDDSTKTCIELEQEMTTLVPLTYDRQPAFYEDPVRGAAIIVGTTMFPIAYGVLGYQEYLGYTERGHIVTTKERIEQLRRLKAEKHCFES
ncbi:MAG: hypothetical protein ABW168_22870 [Sedimenticola sp.]